MYRRALLLPMLLAAVLATSAHAQSRPSGDHVELPIWNKASGEIGEGDGEKAGVAYRMKDGSMVYVPEGGAADQAAAPAPSAAPVNNVGTAPGGMGGR